MLRTPRSLSVQAIVDPVGDATRLSGCGMLRMSSTVKPLAECSCAAECCADDQAATSATDSDTTRPVRWLLMVTPSSSLLGWCPALQLLEPVFDDDDAACGGLSGCLVFDHEGSLAVSGRIVRAAIVCGEVRALEQLAWISRSKTRT